MSASATNAVPGPAGWTLDETIVGVLLVDPATGRIAGRPTIAVAVDTATRMVVAMDVALPGSARPLSRLRRDLPEVAR